MEPNSALRWIECHPAFVAATQDGLLILTILVAIGVPTCVEFLRHRQRRAGSIAYAVALIVPIIQVRGDISRVRHYIGNFQNMRDDVSALLNIAPNMLLVVPAELARAMWELHHFDNYAVQAIRSAAIAIQGYNAIIDKIMEALTEKPGGFDQAREKFIASATAALDHVEEQLDRTIGQLKDKGDSAKLRSEPP
jgi:hypothetical protein